MAGPASDCLGPYACCHASISKKEFGGEVCSMARSSRFHVSAGEDDHPVHSRMRIYGTVCSLAFWSMGCSIYKDYSWASWGLPLAFERRLTPVYV